MKQRLISRFLVFLLSLSLCAIPALAADVVDPPNVEKGVYYVDQAACLTAETKDYINRQNIALTNAVNGQVGVVTLEFLNDLNSEEYAYEVLNQWGVGDAEENNGTVFVLVTAEKKCWITSGSGIENDLSGGVLEEILEKNCYDSLDAGRYDEAVYDTAQAIFSWYEDYYNIRLSDYNSTTVENGNPAFGGGGSGSALGSAIHGIVSLIAMVLIVVVFLSAFSSAMRHPGLFWCLGPTWCGPGPRGPRGPFGGGGGFGSGGFGGGGFGGGGFGGGSFGGGGGHGGGAGRR